LVVEAAAEDVDSFYGNVMGSRSCSREDSEKYFVGCTLLVFVQAQVTDEADLAKYNQEVVSTVDFGSPCTLAVVLVVDRNCCSNFQLAELMVADIAVRVSYRLVDLLVDSYQS